MADQPQTKTMAELGGALRKLYASDPQKFGALEPYLSKHPDDDTMAGAEFLLSPEGKPLADSGRISDFIPGEDQGAAWTGFKALLNGTLFNVPQMVQHWRGSDIYSTGERVNHPKAKTVGDIAGFFTPFLFGGGEINLLAKLARGAEAGLTGARLATEGEAVANAVRGATGARAAMGKLAGRVAEPLERLGARETVNATTKAIEHPADIMGMRPDRMRDILIGTAQGLGSDTVAQQEDNKPWNPARTLGAGAIGASFGLMPRTGGLLRRSALNAALMGATSGVNRSLEQAYEGQPVTLDTNFLGKSALESAGLGALLMLPGRGEPLKLMGKFGRFGRKAQEATEEAAASTESAAAAPATSPAAPTPPAPPAPPPPSPNPMVELTEKIKNLIQGDTDRVIDPEAIRGAGVRGMFQKMAGSFSEGLEEAPKIYDEGVLGGRSYVADPKSGAVWRLVTTAKRGDLRIPIYENVETGLLDMLDFAQDTPHIFVTPQGGRITYMPKEFTFPRSSGTLGMPQGSRFVLREKAPLIGEGPNKEPILQVPETLKAYDQLGNPIENLPEVARKDEAQAVFDLATERHAANKNAARRRESVRERVGTTPKATPVMSDQELQEFLKTAMKKVYSREWVQREAKVKNTLSNAVKKPRRKKQSELP